MLPTQLLVEDSWSNTQKDKIGALFLDAAENPRPKTVHLPKHEYPHFEAPTIPAQATNQIEQCSPNLPESPAPVTLKNAAQIPYTRILDAMYLFGRTGAFWSRATTPRKEGVQPGKMLTVLWQLPLAMLPNAKTKPEAPMLETPQIPCPEQQYRNPGGLGVWGIGLQGSGLLHPRHP